MKRTILQFSFCLCLLAINFQSFAQVTIDQSTYIRTGNYTDENIDADPSGFILPAEGADLVWDYSGLVPDVTNIVEHVDATGDPDFPTATGYYNNNLIFQSMIIPSDTYESVNENGWQVVGSKSQDISYSITSISGGSNDTLRFIGGAYPNDVPSDLMQFPLTWEDQWTSTVKSEIHFEVTVAAFGLNKVPGKRKRFTTATREIVGYGELIIPKTDGTPSAPMEVLLMKVNSSVVDSFFLAGAPAPDALLGAFGLIQGGQAVFPAGYTFYRPGFGSAVLFLDADGEIGYRPQGAEVNTAISDAAIFETVNTFPNPVASGSKVTFQPENAMSIGTIAFYDISGRQVFKTECDHQNVNQFQVSIPSNLGQGVYFYNIHDEFGNIQSKGKLMVK